MGIDPKTIIERPDGSTIEFGKLKVRDQLAHEFVAANIPAAESLKELIAGFKLKVVAELMAHRDMMLRDYGVQVGGKGGGRPDFAQAGGDDPDGLDGALASVESWVREQLG